MRLCRQCVLPDTRPGLQFDDTGVCSACRGHELKARAINWEERALALDEIVAQAQATPSGQYQCVVPISGGKDSWYQVISCKKRSLRVLGVTWRTPGRTELGQRNLDGLIASLGIDHIDYSINPETERRFMRASFERTGSTAVPMHMAIWAITYQLAVGLGIPLVVWGENPQLEYGGDTASQLATDLDYEWIRRFGVTNDTHAADWIGAEGLTEADLIPYRLPALGGGRPTPRSIFLGAFEPWDLLSNAETASRYGFSAAPTAQVGVWEFADIDCSFISIHHYLKWYKFGFTRDFDNLSVLVRYGRLPRDEAIDILRDRGASPPVADIEAFCAFVGRSADWFWETAEQFRDRRLWNQVGGRWEISGFPIDGWRW